MCNRNETFERVPPRNFFVLMISHFQGGWCLLLPGQLSSHCGWSFNRNLFDDSVSVFSAGGACPDLLGAFIPILCLDLQLSSFSCGRRSPQRRDRRPRSCRDCQLSRL